MFVSKFLLRLLEEDTNEAVLKGGGADSWPVGEVSVPLVTSERAYFQHGLLSLLGCFCFGLVFF